MGSNPITSTRARSGAGDDVLTDPDDRSAVVLTLGGFGDAEDGWLGAAAGTDARAGMRPMPRPATLAVVVTTLAVVAVGCRGDDGDAVEFETGFRNQLEGLRTDLELTMAAAGPEQLTVTVTNHGPSGASPVIVELTVPPGTTIEASGCDRVSDEVARCDLGPYLSPEASNRQRARTDAQIQVSLGGDGSRTIHGEVYTELQATRVDDPDETNNTASATI